LENNSFKKGIIDGLPICIGYLAVSFAFGISAVSAGLSVFEAILISMTNLTSAGQLAAVPIISAGGSILELALTQLIINSRYSLMSVSLSQKFSKSVKFIDRFLIAFGNTDEIFAVGVSNKLPIGSRYMFGLILTPWFGWTGGTLLGAVLGNVLPEIVISSLGVAIYGMFVAIVVPEMKKQRAICAVVGVSIALSLCFNFIPLLGNVPSGFVIIICAIISSLIMAVLAPINPSEVEADA
jgi:4-azaleucine resistance transporter AzlC